MRKDRCILSNYYCDIFLLLGCTSCSIMPRQNPVTVSSSNCVVLYSFLPSDLCHFVTHLQSWGGRGSVVPTTRFQQLSLISPGAEQCKCNSTNYFYIPILMSSLQEIAWIAWKMEDAVVLGADTPS